MHLHVAESRLFDEGLLADTDRFDTWFAREMPHRSRRACDHRIKEQIIGAGDPGLFPELEIPRSTATSWIRRGLGESSRSIWMPEGSPPCGAASSSWRSGWRC